MKLDYLNDVTDDGKYPSAEPAKLLRLCDFEISELLKLRQEIKRNFVEENSNELTISNLDFIKAINCALTLHLANCDLGIKLSSKHNHEFVGSFSKETYVNMIKKKIILVMGITGYMSLKKTQKLICYCRLMVGGKDG